MDIREEILHKRRAGKLPGDTTSVLKAWWQSHSKWPYPIVRVIFTISSLHWGLNVAYMLNSPRLQTVD